MANNTHCIATVTSDGFISGTFVMLRTFIKYNPWFRGEIVVFHDGLSDKNKGILKQCINSLILQPVNGELKSICNELMSGFPAIRQKVSHFYSIESFSLAGYDKVIFCDSDILFLGSIEPLFELDKPLICCGDSAWYQGMGRDRNTFRKIIKNRNNIQSVIEYPFNSGLMLIDKVNLTPENYSNILSMINMTTWKNIETAHTDQIVLNLYFDKQVHIADCSYNYLLIHRDLLLEKTGVGFKQVNLIHYNGTPKPWRLDKVIEQTGLDPASIPFYRKWLEEYQDTLSYLSLRKVLPN